MAGHAALMTATTAPELRISDRAVGYRRVIALGGRLHGGTAAALRNSFWDAVECGAQQVWLDLSRLEGIDRPGAQTLEALGMAAHELNRALVLVGARGAVHAALLEFGVDEELPMFPTLSAAHYAHTG
jgi:anti-anti-sigma regulatory factor